ncbi:MAG: DHA2 family efflux MFS transporter permease subunit [Acidimicrobiales bacterium]
MSAEGAEGAGLRLSSTAGRWVLVATVLGSSLAAIDSTVVGIAVPSIGRDFHLAVSSLQWVVTGYLLTLAGLLLVGGSLGDHFGRRKVFVIGVVWFAVASLLCAVATGSGFLIGARILQGAGGALLTPGSLAILQASFAPEDRSRAIGAWAGLGGVGTAVGPFLGGFLVQAVSWRLIFVINLPLAVLVVAVALRHVPESRDPDATGPVDVVGGALVTTGLLALTAALIEAPTRGWDSGFVVGTLAGSLVLFALFVVRERRTTHPLLPLAMFAARQFSAINAVTFVVYGALGGALFLLPVELQQVSGYSPLQSGIALLPLTAVLLALSSRSGALAARIGPRLQLSVGPVLVGAGMALFYLVGPSGNYLTEVLPAVAVLALGLAVTVAPLTASALAAAPDEHASLASAVNNDVARAGSLVAVAVLPALSGLDGRSYLHPVLFSAGFHRAVVVAGVVAAAGGVLGAVSVRDPGRAGHLRPKRRSVVCCPLDATSLVASVPEPARGHLGRRPARRAPGARQWRP